MIRIDDIIVALKLKPENYSKLEKIVLEYGRLTQKTDSIEKQSWFFKKGERNNLKKLKDLTSEFEKIRSDCNSKSIDNLIIVKNNENEKRKTIHRHKRVNSIDRIALASLNSNISYLEEILDVKSRVNKVKEIDYYFNNSDELIELLGW